MFIEHVGSELICCLPDWLWECNHFSAIRATSIAIALLWNHRLWAAPLALLRISPDSSPAANTKAAPQWSFDADYISSMEAFLSIEFNHSQTVDSNVACSFRSLFSNPGLLVRLVLSFHFFHVPRIPNPNRAGTATKMRLLEGRIFFGTTGWVQGGWHSLWVQRIWFSEKPIASDLHFWWGC